MLEHIPVLRGMYTTDWLIYRKRRLQFYVANLVFSPMLAVLSVVAGQVAPDGFISIFILVPAGLASVVTAFRLSAFACPRCRKPFFHGGFGGNPLTHNCNHCDLPKWATCDPIERERWAQEPDWHCVSCDANNTADAERCIECGWTYSSGSEIDSSGDQH